MRQDALSRNGISGRGSRGRRRKWWQPWRPPGDAGAAPARWGPR